MDNKISVIIPVYNAEKTIEKCVESIIYGELESLEVILIEDCSRDDSWTICQSLSSKYENVHSYQNEENKGVSYTRNHGLKKAKGEYVLFVDSDDWVSGRYAKTLLKTAEIYPDSLVICGLHFYDNVIGKKRDYLWKEAGEPIYVITREQFFDLSKKFHLQQLWNKIFKRSIIEDAQICFDEKQNMGEDFEFVLDYMNAAKCKKCVVINEALYYYLRANKSSLMSQFGLVENENEYKRFDKLLEISGRETLEVQNQYNNAIEDKKMSSLYFISRAQNTTKKKKIELIENIMQDGYAKKYYHKQCIIMLKEKLFYSYDVVRKVLQGVQGRLQRHKNAKTIAKVRLQTSDKQVSIISQNCIGGVIYHDMGWKFLSPTINLYFECPDFVRFVLDLEKYMELELQMKWEEEYPVGMLGDVKIYFMHYQTCTEAKEAWERRKERINWDNIVIISTDMENFSKETFEYWKQISYKKVLFTAQQWTDEGGVYFSKYKQQGKVADLIPKREFYKDEILRHL